MYLRRLCMAKNGIYKTPGPHPPKRHKTIEKGLKTRRVAPAPAGLDGPAQGSLYLGYPVPGPHLTRPGAGEALAGTPVAHRPSIPSPSDPAESRNSALEHQWRASDGQYSPADPPEIASSLR